MKIREAKTLLTPDEYLVKEREAEYRSEYRDGHIIAMTAASRKHILISGISLVKFTYNYFKSGL